MFQGGGHFLLYFPNEVALPVSNGVVLHLSYNRPTHALKCRIHAAVAPSRPFPQESVDEVGGFGQYRLF